MNGCLIDIKTRLYPCSFQLLNSISKNAVGKSLMSDRAKSCHNSIRRQEGFILVVMLPRPPLLMDIQQTRRMRNPFILISPNTKTRQHLFLERYRKTLKLPKIRTRKRRAGGEPSISTGGVAPAASSALCGPHCSCAGHDLLINK